MTVRKRTFCVIFIILLAILVGFLCDRVWDAVEESTHPMPYRETVMKYSLEYEVPEPLIYAVIKTESGFDTMAESSVGARGLMQMMEPTFTEMTGKGYLEEYLPFTALYTPEVSIRYGVYYLRYLYDLFGDWRNVLAAYNGGLGNVRKWLENPEYSDGQGNLTYIPFDETRRYVEKVEDAVAVYEKLYFNPTINTFEKGEKKS
jgi:soluble lytic murein transglycosylase